MASAVAGERSPLMRPGSHAAVAVAIPRRAAPGCRRRCGSQRAVVVSSARAAVRVAANRRRVVGRRPRSRGSALRSPAFVEQGQRLAAWPGRRGGRAACGPWEAGTGGESGESVALAVFRLPVPAARFPLPLRCRSRKPARSWPPALVGIVMGSRSDWETMQHAAAKLDALGVAHEVRVVSAHRTPTCCSNTPRARNRAWPARDHRRRRRRGAPAGHARGQDRGAGARRAGNRRR